MGLTSQMGARYRKTGGKGRAGVSGLCTGKAQIEPLHDLIERQAIRCDVHDQIVNARIIGNRKPIPAAFDKEFYDQPCRSFVTINEAMVAHDGMQQHRLACH